jgi:hypothetical protein
VDVEAWRKSLDPRVLDAWLIYASIEPETFIERRPAGQAGPPAANTPHMVDAWQAQAMLQRKYGR